MNQGWACRQCSLWCFCVQRTGNRYHRPNWVNVLPASKHTSHLTQRQEPPEAGALDSLASAKALSHWAHTNPKKLLASLSNQLQISQELCVESAKNHHTFHLFLYWMCILPTLLLTWVGECYKLFWNRSLKILRMGIGELCHSFMMWSSWDIGWKTYSSK